MEAYISDIPLLPGSTHFFAKDVRFHEGPATLRLENVPLSRLPQYERLTAVS